MTETTPKTPSPLRARMIEDMTVRGLGTKTQHEYVRCVRMFAAFLGRPPDTAVKSLGCWKFGWGAALVGGERSTFAGCRRRQSGQVRELLEIPVVG